MNKRALVGGLAGLIVIGLAGCGNAVVPYRPNNTTNNITANNTAVNNTAVNNTSTNSFTTNNGSSNSAVTNSSSTNNTVNNTAVNNTSANSSASNNTSGNTTNTTNTTNTSTSSSTLTSSEQSTMASAIQNLLNNSATPPQDCSALVQNVYKKAGVQVPRTVSQQAGAGSKVANASQLQYGDIVFFDLSSQANTPTFDGIYVGNGQFVAVTTHGTMSISLDASYWKGKFLYGVRVPKK